MKSLHHTIQSNSKLMCGHLLLSLFTCITYEKTSDFVIGLMEFLHAAFAENDRVHRNE